MRSRYKTFAEFKKQITIARRLFGGRLIVCNLDAATKVLVKSSGDLWNSKRTKKSFLVKLYIDEVLKKKELSPLIRRISGYEFLGLRMQYKKDTVVVADAWEVVHTGTGEVGMELLVASITNPFRTQPYKIVVT